LVLWNNKIYFVAQLKIANHQLYATEGKVGDATLITPEGSSFIPGALTVNSYTPSVPVVSGDKLYFAAKYDYSTGNELYTITSTGTGVNTETENLSPIAIYPNPATTSFSLSGISENYKISVFNNLGQIYLKKNNFTSGQSIDVSTWAPGLYFIHIQNSTQFKTLPMIVTE
jgi:hypothetical protein